MTEYLTFERLVEINREVTKISGDPHTVQNESNLRHVLEAVRYKYEGNPEAVLLKAAYLLFMLAGKAHAFTEGNKRTAVTSTIAFLHLNGYRIDTAEQEELVNFVLELASGKHSLTRAEKWLGKRVKKRVQD
ncbi:MAG: type II toxin-antitoxin system death-on-curing family toxin [Candidatus Micrarchaeota archaeon]